MTESGERRRRVRIYTLFETLLRSSREEGTGVLCDVSIGGARIEKATLRPEVGSEVGLLVCQPEEDQSFELRGKVIRLTESGFSIAYGKAPAELHLLLLDANPDTAPFDGATPTADEPSEESHYSIAQLEALVSRITAEIRKKRD